MVYRLWQIENRFLVILLFACPCCCALIQDFSLFDCYLNLADSISSAAYKKWEKAAIAGVSLVADAAEHLERTSTDKEVERQQGELGEVEYLHYAFIMSTKFIMKTQIS